MTMCIRERVDVRPWSTRARRATSRASTEIWNEARAALRRGRAVSCAARSRSPTAFYAPVAFRFRTYGVAPAGAAGDYLAALLAHPFVREWEDAALAETDDRRGGRAARHLSRQARGTDRLTPSDGGCRGRRAAAEDPRRRGGAARRCACAAAAPRTSMASASPATCSTRARVRGIVDYDPTELVRHRARRHAARRDRGRARAGAARCSPFEPPRFGAGGDARRRDRGRAVGPAPAVRGRGARHRARRADDRRHRRGARVRRARDEERRGLRRRRG